MRHLFAVPLAAGLALAQLPVPARAADTPKPPELKIKFEKYKLDNGLTVILHEDHSFPTVVVDLWFKVGSKDERPGRSGFAHLFEHLMFMGTEAVPNGAFDSIMESAGGSNNASTSEDRTNYFEFGPSNLLETFLWLEADRLGALPDAMTKEKVDLQRDVVKNERRQSYENRPYGRVELIIPERMYPDNHPYHHPVIGSHEDLTAASVEDVKEFFRAYYVASNASLVVAGDFDPKVAKQLIQRYMAKLPKKPVPPHAAPKPVSLAKAEKVVVGDAIKLERAQLVWHSAPAFAPGDAEADLLAAILGGGKSSRLYKALVYEKKIAQAVEVEQRSQQYGSLFVITATAQPGHAAAELEQAIDIELAALKTRPPAQAELDRARSFVETQLLRALERGFGLAEMLQLFEFHFGDPGQLEKRLLGRYENVALADVGRQIESVLQRPRLTVHVVPEKKEKTQ